MANSQILYLTIRSKGSSVIAALSSSLLYSSSSQSLCKALRGSLRCTGIATLDKSLPMLFLRMFHRLIVLLVGLGVGRQDLRVQRTAPSSTEPWSEEHNVEGCRWGTLVDRETLSHIYLSNGMAKITWVRSFTFCLVAEIVHRYVITNVTDVWVIFWYLKTEEETAASRKLTYLHKGCGQISFNILSCQYWF